MKNRIKKKKRNRLIQCFVVFFFSIHLDDHTATGFAMPLYTVCHRSNGIDDSENDICHCLLFLEKLCEAQLSDVFHELSNASLNFIRK